LSIEEFVNSKDYYKITKSMITTKQRKPFDNDVIAFDNSGKPLFTNKNMVILSGALFILSKMFNLNYPILPSTINTDLGVNGTETATGVTGIRREDIVSGFNIGIGGSTLTFGQVTPVQYRDKNVSTMIPFRFVPTAADLVIADQAKYALKRTEGLYYAYYIKKFESTPTLKCEFEDGTNVAANVHTLTDERIINTYVEILMKVSKDDCREYFENLNGNISQCLINSIGLVHGYYEDIGGGILDLKGIRNITKFNTNNEALDNYEKEINIVYKVFV
jgi:hypothetical protein